MRHYFGLQPFITGRHFDVLGKAVDGGQADWEMLDLLGRAYVLAGKPDQAMQSLQRAAALAPDNADILGTLPRK